MYHGKEAEVLTNANGVTVLKLRSETGDGLMTTILLTDGIAVNYIDFHMSEIRSEFATDKEIFCLDHCREGRIEQALRPGITVTPA